MTYIPDPYYSSYGGQYMNTSIINNMQFLVKLKLTQYQFFIVEYVPGIAPTQQQAQTQAHYYLQDVYSNPAPSKF